MKVKIALLLALIVCLSFNHSNAERPAHCLEPHPRGYGFCDMLITGFYYNADRDECEQWNEDGCGVKSGNSYDSINDCVRDCIGVK